MKLDYQLKRGVQLLGAARGRDRGTLLRYLSRNFLNKVIGVPLRAEELNVSLSGLRVTVRMFSSELGAYLDIFHDHVYEYLPGFVAQPGQTIVDAGANVGFYTLRQAAAVGPSGRVYAFEPNPYAYALLRRNVEQNSFSWVTCLPFALSAVEGAVGLTAHDRFTSTGKTFYLDDEVCETKNSVPSTTLDNIVKAYDIRCIHMLKMDTEGAETEIVRGGLDRALPMTQRVVMESHLTRYDVRDLLAPLEFAFTEHPVRNIVYFERGE